MRKLYYLGKPGDGYGWGVANTNLIKALEAEGVNVIQESLTRCKFDAPVFTPVINHALKPEAKYRAPRVLGYCFTEWPMPDGAARNARIYDVLFAGSNWNAGRLRAAGVRNVDVLIQGIDFDRFKVQPPSERKGFVVFSGGKYEFRKAQDIVIACMKPFMNRHSDVSLIASWHNPWPQTMESMNKSWLINPGKPEDGVPDGRAHLLPPVPNEKTPDMYMHAHIGLFPNRCEAGTNLVMSEFMACGRPVIASFEHGHKDVLSFDGKCPQPSDGGPYCVDNGSFDPAGWFNPNVSDLLWHLETAYANKDELHARGLECRKLVERFTWQSCAAKICARAFE